MHLDNSRVQPRLAEPDEVPGRRRQRSTWPASGTRSRSCSPRRRSWSGESDYPTEKIARERAGLPAARASGYANLGALLMARGLPYDSDGGRAWAGAITAIMTGQAYRTSARIAEVDGAVRRVTSPTATPMLRVMRKHRAAADEIDAELVPEGMLSRREAVVGRGHLAGRAARLPQRAGDACSRPPARSA